MKYFKTISILIFTISFIVSCNSPERSIGMTTWTDDGTEYKYYLGTDEAINIVKGFNDAWQSKEFDKMKDYCVDSLTITRGDGVGIAIDKFIEELKENELERQENSITFEWKTDQMFSVDLDPKIGGEHVHVYVSAKWVNDTVTNAFRGINRAYVIDGKIVDWEGFYRSENND